MQLCFATNNSHKLEEISSMLNDSIRLISLREAGIDKELEETQDTLKGNARQKARNVYELTGHSCFADDTGLEVEALQGAPGVYSARYAGPQRSSTDNMNLLLTKLKNQTNRKATFRSVLCLILPQGEWTFEGILEGIITDQPRGSGGFGYDPLFLPDGFSLTLAEMPLHLKNGMSHRARAFRKLADFLKTL